MSWKRATFNGQKVWVEVGADGRPLVQGGRVPMRYQAAPGAKIYRAGASRVTVEEGAPLEDLGAGTSADEGNQKKGSPASRGSGFGKAGTRSKEQAAMAAAEAKSLLASLSESAVRAYADGACRGNPGPAGSGAVVELPDGRRGEGSMALGEATNNVGELEAIGLVLDLLEEAGIGRHAEVHLLTDSSYARGVVSLGWKAKANTELIEGLRERLDDWPNFELHWVAGHAGIAGNERADALARKGVDGVSARKWSRV